MTATCHNTAVAVGYQGHSGRCYWGPHVTIQLWLLAIKGILVDVRGGHMTATCHNTAVAVGYQGHSGRC